MEQFADVASATLNNGSALTSGLTSTIVTSAANIPATGTFRVLIGSELIKVTAVSGSTWTIVRGDGGTTAATHNDGDIAYVVLTAEALNALVSHQVAGTEVSNRRVLNLTGGMSLVDDPSNSRCDLQIGTESTWTSPGAVSNFTWVNQGSATATLQTSSGGIYLLAPAASGDNVKMLVKTAPATPYTIIGRLQPNFLTVNFHSAGLIFRESGTSKIIRLAWSGSCEVDYYTGSTTFSAALTSFGAMIPGVMWGKLTADGTNITFSVSSDGVNWILLRSEAKGSHFTTAPDQVGFFANSNNTSFDCGMTLLSWTGA